MCLCLWLTLKKTVLFWVVELGASQKGDVKRLVEIVKPHVRALTAIGEEHLDTFGCLDDVILGNGEIFYGMEACGELCGVWR